MKSFASLVRRYTLSMLIAFSATTAYSQVLQKPIIGAKAPELTLSRWIKDEPSSYFKKGHVYVVEFSGVGCPPCRKAIPHLTSLAKRYKDKVTIISVYTLESNKKDTSDYRYIERISRFVADMGEKIGYSVAADVPAQTTAIAWGIHAIPAVFLINAEGNLIWQGNPNDLDSILSKVLVGASPDEVIARQNQNKNSLDYTVNELFKIRDRGNLGAALTSMDSLLAIHKDSHFLYKSKFMLLAGSDDVKAYQWLAWLLKQPLKGFDWERFIGLPFSSITRTNRNYKLELEAIERAIQEAEIPYLSEHSLATKAETYANMGEYSKSVECYRLIIQHSKGVPTIQEKVQENERRLFAYQYQEMAQSQPNIAHRWLKAEFEAGRAKINIRLINLLLEESSPDYPFLLKLTNGALQDADDSDKTFFLGKKAELFFLMKDTENAIKHCLLAINKTNSPQRLAGLENRLKMYRAQSIAESPSKRE